MLSLLCLRMYKLEGEVKNSHMYSRYSLSCKFVLAQSVFSFHRLHKLNHLICRTSSPLLHLNPTGRLTEMPSVNVVGVGFNGVQAQ